MRCIDAHLRIEWDGSKRRRQPLIIAVTHKSQSTDNGAAIGANMYGKRWVAQWQKGCGGT
jgi:hypothetical protein